MSSGGNFFNDINPIKNPTNLLIPGSGIVNDWSQQGATSAPQLPGVNPPNVTGDQNSISGLSGQINNLYGNLGGTGAGGTGGTGLLGSLQGNYANEKDYLNDMFKTQDQNLVNDLTSNDPTSLGGQMKGAFNNSGLLNSGAFNSALASQFSNLGERQGEQAANAAMGQFQDVRNVLGQATNANIGINTGGLNRQFGLEDWYNNAQQQQKLAQLGVNTQTNLSNQNSQNQRLGSVLNLGGQIGGAAIGK